MHKRAQKMAYNKANQEPEIFETWEATSLHLEEPMTTTETCPIWLPAVTAFNVATFKMPLSCSAITKTFGDSAVENFRKWATFGTLLQCARGKSCLSIFMVLL